MQGKIPFQLKWTGRTGAHPRLSLPQEILRNVPWIMITNKFKRDIYIFRIFVSRTLRLDKIKFYGFDMDYTLAEYKAEEVKSIKTNRYCNSIYPFHSMRHLDLI